MGRPARHDRDRLLDVAVGLAFEGGPAAVTIAAVARAAGAPSGSVYHRFPSAAALHAALWLRTLERFQDGFVAAADVEGAARHVVAWSRGNPREARVLQYGARDFGLDEWPEAEKGRLDRGNQRVRDALEALAARLGLEDDLERVVLAAVDVPHGLVARHLRDGTEIPEGAEDLAAEAAGVLVRK